MKAPNIALFLKKLNNSLQIPNIKLQIVSYEEQHEQHIKVEITKSNNELIAFAWANALSYSEREKLLGFSLPYDFFIITIPLIPDMEILDLAKLIFTEIEVLQSKVEKVVSLCPTLPTETTTETEQAA